MVIFLHFWQRQLPKTVAWHPCRVVQEARSLSGQGRGILLGVLMTAAGSDQDTGAFHGKITIITNQYMMMTIMNQ